MATKKSFREIAQWMDDRTPVTSVRSLANQHRQINLSDSGISYRKITDRHKGISTSKEISFLFYNTWLIHGFQHFGGTPWRSLRADLIGKEIKNSKYDIAALCEVFDEKYQKIIKNQRFPYDAMGPEWDFADISSGLYTLSKFQLSYKRRRFVEKGPSYSLDSYSNKGVLLTTVDLGIGKIDLYSTHLFYGSSDFYPIKRRNIQLRQLQELVDFIKETHNPKHIVIVAGDMNINPGRSEVNGRAYEMMAGLFSNITLKNGSKISLEDLWKIKGGKKGGTNMPTKGCEPENRYINPGTNICYCSDDTNDVKDLDEGRYDCIFVQKPAESHDIIIDFSRMKRRPFPFPELDFEAIESLLNNPVFVHLKQLNKNKTQIKEYISNKIKKECNGHLSDHLGVDVKFMINKK